MYTVSHSWEKKLESVVNEYKGVMLLKVSNPI